MRTLLMFAGSMWIMEKIEEEKVEKVIDDVMRETTKVKCSS